MMKFGVSLFPTHLGADPVEVAVQAEQLGFESVFVSEHTHIPLDTDFPLGDEVPMEYRSMFDPFVALGAMASATRTIKLGTAILIIPQHDPINCAKAVSTLDLMSNGRVIFGIGAGWNPPEMENHGVAFADRFKITRERIGAMKSFWTQEEAGYQGDLVKITPSWQWPKPVQKPHPPILVAGAGPNILKRVVALGDGWMPVLTPQWDDSLIGRVTALDDLPEMVATTRRLEAEAGKARTSITAMGLPPEPEFVDRLAENGVDRMVLRLPHENPETVFEELRAYADAIAQYVA